MNHSIEDGTAQSTFDLLVSKATRLELIADELLIAIEVRFGQRASMIATFLLPRLASLASNGSKDLIPRQRGSLTGSCGHFFGNTTAKGPWRRDKVE